jgi:hypothetical protein
MLPCLFAIQGCHVSQFTSSTTVTCAVSGPTEGACSIAVTEAITVVPKVVAQTVGASDLASTADGSYTISASAPSSLFSANTSVASTTTITATTDTGYSSTITVSLTPTSPAIAPVNEGDAVFSYNLPNTPAFNSWVQTVAANTNASMTLTSSAALPLQITAAPGSFTVTTVLTSNDTGSVNTGNVQFVRSAPPMKSCGNGGLCPVLPGE